MIYPQGKTIHQNLSAEYTDVPQLLSTLKANGFSGVVEVETVDKKGVFFIASGQVVNAALGVDSDPPAMIGDKALQELFTLAKQPHGVLHVFELTTAEVELATGPLNSELLFQDLSTDFIRMDQFVGKLANEKHTGYIEIFSKDRKQLGTLSFREGEIVGLRVVSESEQPRLFEGGTVAPTLDETVKNGAIFNVYSSQRLSDPSQGRNIGANGGGRTASAKEAAPEPKKPLKEPGAPKEFTLEPRKPPKEPAAAKEPAIEMKEESKPVNEEAPAENQKSDDATENSRGEFLSSLQRILSKTEQFVDDAVSKGTFQRSFMQICVDKSELYHFLDPFEGQFAYDSGKIRLDNAVGTELFVLAISECINLTLSNLQKDFLKGKALPPGLKGEIESAFRHYKEMIKNSGLQSVVPPNMK